MAKFPPEAWSVYYDCIAEQNDKYPDEDNRHKCEQITRQTYPKFNAGLTDPVPWTETASGILGLTQQAGESFGTWWDIFSPDGRETDRASTVVVQQQEPNKALTWGIIAGVLLLAIILLVVIFKK